MSTLTLYELQSNIKLQVQLAYMSIINISQDVSDNIINDDTSVKYGDLNIRIKIDRVICIIDEIIISSINKVTWVITNITEGDKVFNIKTSFLDTNGPIPIWEGLDYLTLHVMMRNLEI